MWQFLYVLDTDDLGHITRLDNPHLCAPRPATDRNEINRGAEKLRMAKPLVQTSVNEIFGTRTQFARGHSYIAERFWIHNRRCFNLVWHLLVLQFCNCWTAVLGPFLRITVVKHQRQSSVQLKKIKAIKKMKKWLLMCLFEKYVSNKDSKLHDKNCS